MTERIYYTHPYVRAFDATVTRAFEHEGRPAAALDRTAFYPTSGGQPFDIGRLGAVDVLDTVDAGGDVIHVLSGPLAEGAGVHGEIDWARRFDHMQQHTGQHVLSAAFDRLFGNPTVGFHLGAESSTIDLARDMSAADLERAVDEANRLVWENRPVSIRFVSPEDARALPLRKPSAREGTLRVIEIDGVDASACGGTHVDRTGGIGIVAVLGAERIRGGVRLTFACGGRALRALRTYRDAVAGSVRALSVLPPELPSAVARALTEAKELRKQVNGLQERLAAHQAAALVAGAAEIGGVRVAVAAIDGWDPPGLKAMAAAAAAAGPACVALLSRASPVALVIARSASVPIDAAALLRQLTARFGGRGGGKPDMAQGGGLTGSSDEIAGAARALLESALTARS